MKYVKELMIICGITLMGEILRAIVPLPIPACIYGIILLYFALITGILRIDQIKATGKFLTGIMPILLIPASVGLMNSWRAMGSVCFQIIGISVFTTFLVMMISGRITQFVIRLEARRKDERNDL